ncbi:M28 family peptidase [Chloroflexota bacterium]
MNMTSTPLSEKAAAYVQKLCVEIPRRPVGSPGNRAATEFFAETVEAFGFETECPEFDCIDWTHGDLHLMVDGEPYEAFVGPYSLACQINAPLVTLSSIQELESAQLEGRIALLQGEIAQEQLMPKNFTFYNPDHHRKIVGLLEAKAPLALIAATSRNPELAGGLYPFPLIEDGDFDIPSAYMTDKEGIRLARHAGQGVSLSFDAERTPARGSNVLARRGHAMDRRVVICAHIDAKDGTPGALDNATGVTVLLLLAELLAAYGGDMGVEIVAFNGEDYYSAPGQMRYLNDNEARLREIVIGINLDGIGYREGNTAYSLYGCSTELAALVHKAFGSQPNTVEGQAWYQSDHSLFIQNGIPAVAITSDRFDELWTHVAHTPRDRPRMVDPARLVRAALALRDLLLDLNGVF